MKSRMDKIVKQAGKGMIFEMCTKSSNLGLPEQCSLSNLGSAPDNVSVFLQGTRSEVK